MHRRAILLSGLGLLSGGSVAGCVGTPPPLSSDGSIALAPGVGLRLPPLASLGRTVEAVQNVVAIYGSRTFAFEGRISAAPDHFTLVCSDPLGRRGISVHWTETGVVYDVADWVPTGMRAQNILADLVIIVWPQAALGAALSGAMVRDTGTVRTVMAGDKTVMRIDYTPSDGGDVWSGHALYRNAAWDYTLTIDSALLEP